MSDDITFCGSDCDNKKCFRHPSNIREPRIPHSFAYLKDTDDCPMYKQEVRLIDANALKYKNLAEVNGKLTYVLTAEEINNAPTVEINDKSLEIARKSIELGRKVGKLEGKLERPQGEWKIIEHENHYLVGIYQCNLCSYKYPCPDEFARNYCPNCGAEMRGKEE